MIRHLVVEKPFSEFILKKLLPEKVVLRVKFFIGGGYTSSITVANSLLTDSVSPVSLIVDTHTNHQESIYDKEDFIIEFLSQMANPARFQVFLAVPEIEILLFHKKSTLEKIVKANVTEAQWITAKYEPREVLKEIFGTDDLEKVLGERLTDDIIKELRGSDFAQAIIKGMS